ncbi:MAG: short-chain dehydrogenase [Chloroflexi bacterium RBG_16_52_11]|nr:MAG: short-chain dehydrogenase [Chloroflexi bacterium RBG_16_52_11]
MTQTDNSMKGKICMVTGATSGIGEATARALAQMGATVIAVGRNPEKSSAVVNRIKQEARNPLVEFMLADLSSQKAIHQLAEEFKGRHHRLDVLINNAGGFFVTRHVSVDEIEMTFALNHLGYFLLTNLLLDVLRASAPSRVVNVSALLHRFARLNFDDLQNQKRYSGWRVYRESKLANVLFTYELARRLEGSGVTANALHPGVVASNLGANNRAARLLRRATNVLPVFISPEEGAQAIVYLATSPEMETANGKYFEKQKAVPSSKASYDKATAAQLWQVSQAMVRL